MTTLKEVVTPIERVGERLYVTWRVLCPNDVFCDGGKIEFDTPADLGEPPEKFRRRYCPACRKTRKTAKAAATRAKRRVQLEAAVAKGRALEITRTNLLERDRHRHAARKMN